MAADYRTLKMALLADTSKFTSGMNSATNQTKTFSQKMKGFAKGVAKAFATAGIAVAAFATKLAIDGVKAYSDFAEVSSKTEVIFGKNAYAIQAWAKTAAKSFGQSRTQALNAAANFAGMAKAGGLSGKEMVKFSKKLTVLASDMASFDNTSVEQAIQAIGSGLRGEAEPLRKYRVLLDDATLKAKAMEMGLYAGKGALTQSAKVMAAYKSIIEQTSDAQGDYGRTSDGLANGTKTLTALWEDAQLTIGEALYPEISKLVEYLNSPKGQKVITDFAQAFADSIKIMAKYLPGVVTQVTKLVSKVAQQGLIGGLLSDPKIAVAAAAYGAGAIAGGAAGGAVAAIAAYAGAQKISDIQTGVEKNLLMGLNPTNEQITGVKIKGKKGKGGSVQWSGNNLTLTPQQLLASAQMTYGSAPTINIVINNAADAVSSARAIKRTLEKLELNGGSGVGVLGFR